MSAFLDRFLNEFFVNIHNVEKENWDSVRFAADDQRKHLFAVDRAVHWMKAIILDYKQFEQAYHLMEDEASRNLMLKILQFDVLDHHHVRMPLNDANYWPGFKAVDQKYLVEKNALHNNDWDFDLYNLPEQNIRILSNTLGVYIMFMLKQYYYRKSVIIQPEPGDICIDGGGCWGDAALHFASSVGERGHVHSFEFVDSNLFVFNKNLELNPHLKERITGVKHALLDKSGVELNFIDKGPSTSVDSGQAKGNPAKTITIDDYVNINKLPKIDYIKMDIEGAEVQALAGAQATIKQFKPKLAICAYHKANDLFMIPQTIKSILPGYRFYLDHYSIHREETVLYAIHD